MPILIPRITGRGFKRKPLLQSWICCLLLMLLTLPSVFSSCHSLDISVSIYPEGQVNIRYGEPLELFCVTDNHSSNDIEFSVNGKSLESEIVNGTTRRLYIVMPERQINTYYCKNTKNNKICAIRVLVDSPPADVTDFNCLSKNLETLNCSWTDPMIISLTKYDLTFGVNNNLIKPACLAARVGATRYCVWSTISQPRYRQMEKELLLYMKACNVIGCNYQNFTIDHYSIVKPDRVYNLKVVNRSPRDVLLRWKVPNNIYDLLPCGVEHIIEYQIAKVDNGTYFRRVDTSNLPLRNSTYKLNLHLPYAHQQYEVRMYIKAVKAKQRIYWSEYEYLVFTTSSDIPNKPPEMIAGAFTQRVHNLGRFIEVYWKQLELYEEAGPNFTYKVQISQGDKTQIIFPNKNISMNFVSLDATLDPLDVTVWSCNINGSSVNSSHLYIPAEKHTRSLKYLVPTLAKHAHDNGTYELSWYDVYNIDNFTLFWCRPSLSRRCVDRLDFAVLDSVESRYILDLPIDNNIIYDFAISVNKGSESSGMIWSTTEFLQYDDLS